MNWTDRQRRLAGAAGVLFLVPLSVLLYWRVGVPLVQLASEPERFRQWVEGFGPWGRVAYMGLVILQILAAFIPGEPLEIAGGYVFGAIEGTVLCLLADAIGSTLVFLLVRRFGVKLVRLFFSQEKLDSLQFLKSSPRRTLLFLIVFMVPGTPKDLLCYFGGLTDMKLPVLILIATLGRIPSVVTSTVGGNALGTKSYGFAAAVFIGTLLISLGGLVLYQRLQKRNENT